MLTSCEEAVFGEDCEGVYEEDGDWGGRLVVCSFLGVGEMRLGEDLTLEETAEAEEEGCHDGGG